MVRVLIVGFGRHAQRIHYPAISELSGIEVVGVVDHQRHEEEIVDYLGKNRLPILSIDQETDQLQALTDFASELRVDAVVISTDPESHTVYAKWAFGRGYHVLMDKPIHAEPGAAHDRKRAIKIHKAYVDLQNELNRARAEHPNLVCEVLTQRRFHPAFQLVKKTVAEIYAKTGCPITYYYAFHNDGQWRTPLEISSIDYHGFNHGYGKASHSGYHFYDLLAWFSEDFSSDKKMDSIRVKAWPNFPSNYITQVSHDVLEKVFPDSKKDTSINASLYSDGFGEIDVMSTIQLKSGSNVVTHAQIDLQHSGLSARSWPTIGDRDLYKGNGRVRHEQHYMNFGPFASILLTSWQAVPFKQESVDKKNIYKSGHEFNLDITIFRNSEIIGGERVETYNLKDIYKPVLGDYSRGHQEDARRDGIKEFLALINNGQTKGTSSLESHRLSSLIMSSVYESVSSSREVNNMIREKK